MILTQKNIIYKSPFVLFKPQDSLDLYNDKWFIFHYCLNPCLQYDDDNEKSITHNMNLII